jgi:hypothetical protein
MVRYAVQLGVTGATGGRVLVGCVVGVPNKGTGVGRVIPSVLSTSSVACRYETYAHAANTQHSSWR